MNKQEMIELQAVLSTIATKGNDTVSMANCLQFLDQKINEANMMEQAMQEQTCEPAEATEE